MFRRLLTECFIIVMWGCRLSPEDDDGLESQNRADMEVVGVVYLH
jgi:hypothetical protein